ncbi:STAS/SEC14 domain-containing protein [Hymenobacter sp. YC55]|uniref:STAS/SEC14 domain-containing protein n=1 Tax=Hymenobacter sp. YC55 TaxID=3034019 RepID=UPI0023F7A3EF|nr:STAS/SEC14 domain-containing protein [Hymenobacter sp. YC55]MDF7815702.1 STAS/SEC14 domain-containing protein [Hymenobacter sp. YC55]
MQELKSPTNRVYLTIDTDHANRWVAVTWQGYLTKESIQAGAAAYTQALAASGYACVLNDTRQVRGPWDHSLEWVINVWAPQAAAAGLQYFALITTPDSFAEESASAFYAQLTAFQAKVFATMEEAQLWLRQHARAAASAATSSPAKS